MIFDKLDTVIVRVADIEAAQLWYQDVFDMTPNFFDDEQRLVVMETGGETTITLWERGPNDGAPPAPKAGAYPIFFVEDLDGARTILDAAGAKPGPIEAAGNTAWFGLADPDGNWIEVCTY